MPSPAEPAEPAELARAWVPGGSGLLGAAVSARLRAGGAEVARPQVPWTDTADAIEALLEHAAAVDPTEVYWCAGAGVVGTSPEALDQEIEVLEGFLARWRPSRVEVAFHASSAGGVYAGSDSPPFTELTTPRPLAAYGHAKLRAEELWAVWSRDTGVPVLLGRLSNLYGPGQDISKPQGLVSQLCRAQLTRQPLGIYVSLDTLRDYLYVDDAASMVLASTRALRGAGAGALPKVLASERAATIGALLGDLHRVSRRRPPVVLASSPRSAGQVRDLRLRSVTAPSTRGHARTPLAAGLGATLEAVRAQLLRG